VMGSERKQVKIDENLSESLEAWKIHWTSSSSNYPELQQTTKLWNPQQLDETLSSSIKPLQPKSAYPP
jgi:hypothetical protein